MDDIIIAMRSGSPGSLSKASIIEDIFVLNFGVPGVSTTVSSGKKLESGLPLRLPSWI